MSKIKTATVRRSIALLMAALLILSLAIWLGTRERMPEKITIAGGIRGGAFNHLSQMLAEELRRSTRAEVVVIHTDGSIDNRELLASGQVDLAMISADTLLGPGTEVVAPVYDEFVHIIVRRDSHVRRITDLNGKHIISGSPGSADHAHAEVIFHHYGVTPSKESAQWGETYELPLLPDVEAAIEITSLSSPGLRQMMTSGDYRLLPIDDARAIAFDHNYYNVGDIPRGLYSGQLAIPPVPVETLSCTARLAASKDAPKPLINATLDALFGERMQREFPGLLSRAEAEQRIAPSWHAASHNYLQPYAGIDTVASFLESLSAAKELVVALIALLWLGWQRYRLLREEERKEGLKIQKERLDIFVNRTLELDKQLNDTTCTEELRDLHRKTTELQHLALSELTEDDLLGDRMFSIFLEQSNSLCRKIENRLLSRRLLALHPDSQTKAEPNPQA
ncbi:TAXI family TRAP transporter solute-binding subunit [Cerasicoccus maritimus]|uniref:TAXI family TRAP transporter solute-binding subunit n=1 Tax=Cerasicoccus maritimus TaxID=490089 RepID=UPI0028526000|nr:TAXI family TRAP transporter solute-binding subunit [Cerasicoccus maritimus]